MAYIKKTKWWMIEKTPAACVIRAFGGVTNTAKALKRSEPAVSLWKERGRVPVLLWPLVLKKTSKVSMQELLSGKK